MGIMKALILSAFTCGSAATNPGSDAHSAVGLRVSTYDDYCYLASFAKTVDGQPPKSAPMVYVEDANGQFLFSAQLTYVESDDNDQQYQTGFCLRSDLLSGAELIFKYGNPSTFCAPTIVTFKDLKSRIGR